MLQAGKIASRAIKKRQRIAKTWKEYHSRMKEFTYTVTDPVGLHARPAGRLATFAKQFSSDIQVRAKDRQADAKRLLSLMSLGATQGTSLLFSISGEDEDAASEALEQFCRTRWGEA